MTGRRPDWSRSGASEADSEPDTRRQAGHIPVLLDAVLAAVAPRDDAVYVDATFGAGGYSMALLEAARCRVVGIDRDPGAVQRGHKLAESSGRTTDDHRGALQRDGSPTRLCSRRANRGHHLGSGGLLGATRYARARLFVSL